MNLTTVYSKEVLPALETADSWSLHRVYDELESKGDHPVWDSVVAERGDPTVDEHTRLRAKMLLAEVMNDISEGRISGSDNSSAEDELDLWDPYDEIPSHDLDWNTGAIRWHTTEPKWCPDYVIDCRADNDDLRHGPDDGPHQQELAGFNEVMDEVKLHPYWPAPVDYSNDLWEGELNRVMKDIGPGMTWRPVHPWAQVEPKTKPTKWQRFTDWFWGRTE